MANLRLVVIHHLLKLVVSVLDILGHRSLLTRCRFRLRICLFRFCGYSSSDAIHASGHSAHYFFGSGTLPSLVSGGLSCFPSSCPESALPHHSRESAVAGFSRFGASPAIAAKPLQTISSILAFHLAFCALLRHPAISHALTFLHRIPTVVILPKCCIYALTLYVALEPARRLFSCIPTSFCAVTVCILNERFKLMLDFLQGLLLWLVLSASTSVNDLSAWTSFSLRSASPTLAGLSFKPDTLVQDKLRIAGLRQRAADAD